MFSRILKVFRAEKKPEKQIQRPPRLVRDITMGKSDFDMQFRKRIIKTRKLIDKDEENNLLSENEATIFHHAVDEIIRKKKFILFSELKNLEQNIDKIASEKYHFFNRQKAVNPDPIVQAIQNSSGTDRRISEEIVSFLPRPSQ